MTPDEALMFKLYDSSPDEIRCESKLFDRSDLCWLLIHLPVCPHAAFVDPSVPDGTPERASIEIRAIIVG